MNIKLNFSLGFIVAAFLLASMASGACPVSGCGTGGDESWTESAQSFISSDIPLVELAQSMDASSFSTSFSAGEPLNASSNATQGTVASGLDQDYASPGPRVNLFPNSSLIEPMQGISGDEVILDVSSQRLSGEARIREAVLFPWNSLIYENGTVRPFSEMASILGRAGISEDDELVVYSDTFSSGEAAFVLWALRLLGHEEVRALDGGLEDWIAASRPLDIEKINSSATTYTPNPRSELLSNYEYVKSGVAQLVDARALQDFSESKIPNATLVDPEKLMENGRLKEAGELNKTFAILNINQPVVVYSDDLLNSSLAWYALQLMGFDSRIYSWQDWQTNETPE